MPHGITGSADHVHRVLPREALCPTRCEPVECLGRVPFVVGTRYPQGLDFGVVRAVHEGHGESQEGSQSEQQDGLEVTLTGGRVGVYRRLPEGTWRPLAHGRTSTCELLSRLGCRAGTDC